VEWSRYFDLLDSTIKERVAKKIGKILAYPAKRHLRKVSFFVDEVGQYRIVYRVFKDTKRVRFYFVGNHKEYEKWYRQGF
jgi:mRNA-degrading endonuclease HigB of HigAB toxin-antitoxin module